MTMERRPVPTRSRQDVERILCRIWSRLLAVEVGPEDDFFELGGYSLLVVRVVSEARQAGVPLAADDVFEHPTVAGLARRFVLGAGATGPAVDGSQAPSVADLLHQAVDPWDPAAPSTVLELVAGDPRLSPLFLVSTGAGNIGYFGPIAARLNAGRPVYGFELPGYRGRVRPLLSVVELAEHPLTRLRRIQPAGPYLLGGFCSGALVALEMAHRLRAAGEEVRELFLVDTPSYTPPLVDPGWGLADLYRYRLATVGERFGLDVTGPGADLEAAMERMRAEPWCEPEHTAADFHRLHLLWAAGLFAQDHYRPRRYEGPAVLFQKTCYTEQTRDYLGPLLPGAEVRWFDTFPTMEVLRDPGLAEVIGERLAR